ncbi:GspH/FimT family pseudopilin [Colwellia sp. 1_MG-2023]|uniref:GspH/FimT family pseudopilin n=1 Tax=unclassified Colwellia TaxID=196834 RepID=UPI001C088131|nr:MULTISPECIES: GspH/FimT family pseudopilin [unclassified Colwellia]MBU2925369.1 GspH/FimT family pseudopilin [Colwellia sp. C2M11]MDO6653501.1 GspH/FimT family pseudopilin [Colwellia sp. 3_MG-2023]MDO6666241.1 GspH/FimT family pseudopilin [Colwellia sp. 2_MG-2023]MDO6690658.1 GspH/FimT family pseudopilin [Colwellia sp. 1_MG-2023]
MLNHKPFINLNLYMKGVTLLELIISVSITAILAIIVIPNFNDFIVKMRVDNEISKLHRMLIMARNTAINSGQNTILCPLNTTSQCSELWGNELSIFIDSNNNKTFDPDEKILQIKEGITVGDQLVYGIGRTMITFKSTGQLSGLANGTFRYCPKDYKEHSRGIIVARSGRVYQSSDLDNDGVDENRGNTEISCE